MPAFQINDAEYSALADEPADVFKLYCVIRRWMDYRTGVSGAVRRLSEQMFREELYIAPTRGRHESGSPTRQKVRSLVDRLISIGAITPIGPLVYQLPNADWDGASKRSATDEQPDQQPDQQPQQKSTQANDLGASSDLGELSATVSETVDSLISNLPPLSVNPMVVVPREGYFAMPLEGWEPNPRTFKAIAFKNSVPVSALTPDVLAAFCSYWSVRPEKEQSQAQWEYQLVDHLVTKIRRAQAGGSTYAHSRTGTGPAARPGSQRRLSAAERVQANVDEQRSARGEHSGTPEPWTAGETLDHHG
ncbi:hypothetical protein IRZ59_21880 [Pseudomonas guariconensis]|uniref:DnaT-like ssDNA-binding domain-containing protein n=1 Tax=Pseudomonas guariconensis TaxID=1288410 RepID=UPI0018A8E3E4|nr:DnaT-like ssDNA-binding domain-containing protein [Pseudomonas guariconensis]MBF8733083.1 hypothetical protein [Pseudomonas guariconensis]